MLLAGFVEANCELLSQLDQVIEKVSASQYCSVQSDLFDASLGGHVRHVLDHYDNFLSAVMPGYPNKLEQSEQNADRPMVNYDSRLREHSIEVDRDFARQRLQRICEGLQHMPRSDIELDIILQIDSAAATSLQHSTIGRELSFLYSHTVHHLAMISFMLRSLGLDGLPRNFGIAPSTIKFREAM